MIDKSKLKELALALNGVAWCEPEDGVGDNGARYREIKTAEGDVVLGEFVGPDYHEARFIAAANPAAILELLAELEETQATLAQRTAEYEEARADRLRFACNRLATTTSTESTDQAHVMPPFAAPAGQHDAHRPAWEYSFTHSSATGRGETTVGPCLTYDSAQAYGVGCFNQREVFVTADLSEASRGAAQGRITSDNGASPAADVGGLTRYEPVDVGVMCKISADEIGLNPASEYVKYADVCALLATKAAQPADFLNEAELIAFLDKFHESDENGMISNRKWDIAQRAIAGIRSPAPSAKQESKPRTATRDQLYTAVIDCAHSIEKDKIVLYRDTGKDGNALSQLGDRLEKIAATSASASLAAPAVQVAGSQQAPEGFAIVPVEPTPAMIEAGDECWQMTSGNAVGYYRAMLAAAPAVPVEQKPEQPDDLAEGIELLESLIDNIAQDGNYSAEVTLTFLSQIKQCLVPAAQAGEPAAPSLQQGMEGAGEDEQISDDCRICEGQGEVQGQGSYAHFEPPIKKCSECQGTGKRN